MVSCILGARTPGGSWVWAQTSNTWIHPSMSDLCQRSQWSRSLQVESRASPSLSLEECLAGAEMTVDILDWVTHKVLQWKFKSLTLSICQYLSISVNIALKCGSQKESDVDVLKVQVSKYTCNIQYFLFSHRQTYTDSGSLPKHEENCFHFLWEGPHCCSDKGESTTVNRLT